ncbi:MAG: S41 family peptidase [Chitinophagales bacterium]|nr:S41 family peptidase [Chitinophagales bacterium]
MKFKFIGTILITTVVLINTKTVFAQSQGDTSVDKYAEIAKNIEIFTSLFKELNSYYVDEIDPNIVIKDAIDGMLDNLDPYTEYIPSSEIDEYQFQTTGKYGGIGAVISEKNGKVMIRQPYEGSPSQKAGLLPGDVIFEIDGLNTKNKNSEEIRQLLMGQPNTSLSLRVIRAISNDTLSFTFDRKEINVGNVPYYGMLGNGVAYIKLDQFTEAAAKNVANALKQLKTQNDVKGIILDLRGNPGGLLNEAVDLCNIFLDKKTLVVETRGKVKDVNNEYRTQGKAVDTETPLAILTDGGSASASEIVSGVIQDYDRGVIIGQNTYGKGLVQTMRSLPYRGKLKVTTYKYYIPSGRCIQAIDYAHKDEDGHGSVVPDSLRKTFYTKNNRPVMDGAGIEPDVKTEETKYSPISLSLYMKDLYFNYANIYKYKHPNIDTNQVFTLTDKEYDDFIKYLSDKDFDYTTKTESILKDLKNSAKKESYYDAISDALKTLEENMKHDKNQDLIKHKDEVKTLLESELASRYQFQRGKIKVELAHDKDVKDAIQLLSDSKKYSEILSETQKK